MNFEFPAEAAAFRTELREFLDQELPSWWINFLSGDDRNLPFTRQFCRKLAAKGWLAMAWPKEYGGSGADIWHQNVLREELWGIGEPRGPQYMNVNYIGPAIMMFGTDEQKERYLHRTGRGLRPREPQNARRGHGQRLQDQRPEDLDQLCCPRGALHPARTYGPGRAEARRPFHVSRGDGNAGNHRSYHRVRRGAAATARAVLRRRRGALQRTAGAAEPGLARSHVSP